MARLQNSQLQPFGSELRAELLPLVARMEPNYIASLSKQGLYVGTYIDRLLPKEGR